LGGLAKSQLEWLIYMPLETLRWGQVMLRQTIILGRVILDVLVDLLQQLHHSNALGTGVLIAKAPSSIGTDNELGKNLNLKHFRNANLSLKI